MAVSLTKAGGMTGAAALKKGWVKIIPTQGLVQYSRRSACVLPTEAPGRHSTQIRTHVSTPGAAGGGHLPGGGHVADGPDLTTDNTVAFSSRLTAAARAVESQRANRLFSDPFAELLAGPDALRAYHGWPTATFEAASGPDATSSTASVGALKLEGDTGTTTAKRMAIRTRFIDDFFEECSGPRGIKQFVLPGAGMDTRGLRLKSAPGTKVFEIDQALVLRVKNALLSKALAENGLREICDGVDQTRVIAVEADLSQAGWEDALVEAGFDPSQPSAWILEGFTTYLDEQELVSLVQTMAEHCSPNSALCAGSISEDAVAKGQVGKNELFRAWKWGSDEPQAFYEANVPDGWRFKEVKLGTPGHFPEGADYGLGFKGEALTYVVGYFSAVR